LFAWRRSFRAAPAAKSEVGRAFVPAVVIAEAASAAPAGPPSGRVEIVLANGRRLRVDVGIDGVGLARLVALLERP
jgi:transposase